MRFTSTCMINMVDIGIGILIGHVLTGDTWNLWWAFHRKQLRAATVQRPWAEAKETLAKVPKLQYPPMLVITVWGEWWEGWESGTYPINSGMSSVIYLL